MVFYMYTPPNCFVMVKLFYSYIVMLKYLIEHCLSISDVSDAIGVYIAYTYT